MEDGTEHDYDSHIMVWQLAVRAAARRSRSNSAANTHPPPPPLQSSPTRESTLRRQQTSSLASSSSLSLRSSSLGLGPTPGSNLALDSQSEYGDGVGLDSENDYDDDDRACLTDSLTVLTSQRASPSPPRPPSSLSSRSSTTVAASSVGTAAAVADCGGGAFSSIETGTDPLAWSQDVESMLNNPPPDTFQSFILSSEPSLSSWVVPPTPLEDRMVSRRPLDYSPFGFARRSGKSTSPPEPREDFTHHFSPGMLEK